MSADVRPERPSTETPAILVDRAEQIRLAKIREAELRTAQFRAEALAHQASADRMRLEDDEPAARDYERRSDAALHWAREYWSSYTYLVLGRDVAGGEVTGP